MREEKREERKRRGERRERGEERGEESGGESSCEGHKHTRQKGQRELVLTVIIINCYLRCVEELVRVCG